MELYLQIMKQLETQEILVDKASLFHILQSRILLRYLEASMLTRISIN